MIGFEPVFDNESKILILGSFPSVISRKENFYYGNKQNKFWKMLENIYNTTLSSIEEKKKFLLNHKIALWDIVESCDIEGSLDINIKNIKIVDLYRVLPPNTNISKILCNGKKSYELTSKYLQKENINIECIYMPSTSPANIRFDISEWTKVLLDI